MLAEEQAANSRYFYELASARFGFSWDKVLRVQAFHFKGGQAAKTGTGGHLPGKKVSAKIAGGARTESGRGRGVARALSRTGPRSRNSAISPTKCEAAPAASRSATNSPPSISRRTSTPRSISAATTSSSTVAAAAPARRRCIFRDNISVPTIPALARARRHLDAAGRRDVTLIITGGLRTPADFAKALALGADAVAIANAAIQAVGCIGMRACHTNNCPVGIATQKPNLVARLKIEQSAQRLARFLEASVDLMKILARACGHSHREGFFGRRSRDLEARHGAALGRALCRLGLNCPGVAR